MLINYYIRFRDILKHDLNNALNSSIEPESRPAKIIKSWLDLYNDCEEQIARLTVESTSTTEALLSPAAKAKIQEIIDHEIKKV